MSTEKPAAPVLRSAIVPYFMGAAGNPRAVDAAERAAMDSGDVSTMHGDELALARFFQRAHLAQEKMRAAERAVYDAP